MANWSISVSLFTNKDRQQFISLGCKEIVLFIHDNVWLEDSNLSLIVRAWINHSAPNATPLNRGITSINQ